MVVDSSPTEGCRVAPYVNIPSLRMAFERYQMDSINSLDALRSPLPAPLTSPGSSSAASAALQPGNLPSMLFYPSPLYALGLGSLAAQNGLFGATKNTSIADLRLKAKQHAATLGLT